MKKRLIATADEGKRVGRECGRKAGTQWALTNASWLELESLACAIENHDFWMDETSECGWPGVVFNRIRPFSPEVEEWGAIAKFWEDIAETLPTECWLRGFCDGAVETYALVRDSI